MAPTARETTDEIAATKDVLRDQLPDPRAVFAEVEAHVKEAVENIKEKKARGAPVIPEIDFDDIAKDRVADEQKREVKHRGCAIVRGTFPRDRAEAWNEELGDYLVRNDYYDTGSEAPADDYFSNLDADRPQIFSIYWSRPQVEARQHEHMAATQSFLDSLWISGRDGETYFDPTRHCTYADRIRRREPGDETLGLSPHNDAGSVERWLDPAYRDVYRHVFSGDWRDFDPFDGAYRTEVETLSSAAVCSMFRTYQGWTALTPQGPQDGTLQLIPIATGMAYVLLRPLLDDVPDDSLCGAEPGSSLPVTERWHAPLLDGLTSIPLVEPGDTVWWHPDVVHAVADEHQGDTYSNVIYIGSAPYCETNAAYLEDQKEAFLAGESPPDFVATDYETDYEGRATLDDLTDLGRRQMGIETW